MIRIGILGKIGSGKSYIADNFGFPVFNADKEVAKITEHKALPQPEQKPKSSTIDDDFDDDGDDLDKIKGDIMRVLSKLDQAEVE